MLHAMGNSRQTMVCLHGMMCTQHKLHALHTASMVLCGYHTQDISGPDHATSFSSSL